MLYTHKQVMILESKTLLPDKDLKHAGSDANEFVVIVDENDEERFRKFDVREDRVGMENIEALHGVERVWALWNKRTPDDIWSRIRSGDRVFFACCGIFSHLGIVSGKMVDRSVAIRLWGDTPQVRQLDKIVLFSSVQEISMKFNETCNLAGIRPNRFTTIYVAKNRIPTPVSLPFQTANIPPGFVEFNDGSDIVIIRSDDVAGAPSRITEAVTRFLRDTKKVKQLKNMYNGKCQICRYVLRRPEGSLYSEVHHLHPLKDDGDDDSKNMLNLCARHHVEFDYLVIGILEDHKTVVDRDGNKMGTVTFEKGHELDNKNILFHLKGMGVK